MHLTRYAVHTIEWLFSLLAQGFWHPNLKAATALASDHSVSEITKRSALATHHQQAAHLVVSVLIQALVQCLQLKTSAATYLCFSYTCVIALLGRVYHAACNSCQLPYINAGLALKQSLRPDPSMQQPLMQATSTSFSLAAALGVPFASALQCWEGQSPAASPICQR